MIAQMMAFLLIVSLVASLAALAAEGGLRRLGVPARWTWLGAMGLGGVLLGAGALLPARPAAAPGMIEPIELPPLVVGGGAGWTSLAALPGAVWILSALATIALLVVTHGRLMRERARWERTRVLGRDVFLSADRGPAVAGVVRPWIVLPRWTLSLPRSELTMVLLHEEEHLRARDCALLGGALALVVLQSWNPIVWWQLRRLRLAMEMDCDRRVLRRDPDAGTYGRSLLSVAARASGPALGLAAFTERGLSLRQRIAHMTARRGRWTTPAAGLMLALAALVGVQACFVEISVTTNKEGAPAATTETPVVDVPIPEEPPPLDVSGVPEERLGEIVDRLRRVEEERARVRAAGERTREDVAAEPTFTPMTVRPEIVNRNEVMRAMEAEYPPLLRDAGIGGTVRVHFFIDETGTVRNRLIAASSRHQALDEAALKVANVYRFSPALNRDEPVPVWVQFNITFQVR